MTKAEFRDDIVMAMAHYLSSDQVAVLKDILNNRLQKVEFDSIQLPATCETNNRYYIEMFKAFKSSRLSEKTMKSYLYTIERFDAMVNKPFSMISSIDIECFLMEMKKTSSEVSLNNYKRNLSAFFSWMVNKHIITFNPCKEVDSYKEIKKPIDHLNPEDYEQIKQACATARDRALIEFMRCTALRVGELVSVDVKDIDFGSGKVIVYGHKTKTYRIVMIDKIAEGYIKAYFAQRGISISSDEPLFVSERGGSRLSEDGIRNILHKIKENGDLDRRLYPHLFRKSCATSIIRRGGTVGDAGDYLGHTENTVTGRHYAYKDDQHTVNIFNKYVACV